MSAPREEWRPVPTAPGYEASSLGRIRSVDRVILKSNGIHQRFKGVLISPAAARNGYLHLNVCGQRTRMVHQLVLEAFVGPMPPGMQGCHNDGNRQNNRIDNLRWDTPQANAQDTIRMGANPRVRQTHCMNGHPLNGPNLRLASGKRVHRICSACSRARIRIYNDAQRGREVEDFQALADRYYAEIVRTGGARMPQRLASHCVHGHEYTPENTYTTASGRRTCRACARKNHAAYKARNRINTGPEESA